MLRKFRESHILFFICVFGFAFCLTNGFANDDGAILEGRFKAPTADGAGYIQGNAEIQRGPDRIIGTPDFEKMRDLPRDSQDYQLGTKVGWIILPSREDPNLVWSCTGFLVGPDLFMTNHHCLHDDFGLLQVVGSRIFMEYYQEPEVDPTRGGVTARVTEILRMDEPKDYALLRLDTPIGDTYGWLELDTVTRPNSSQSVKLISHPAFRSKEIVRRNTEIVDIPLDHPLGQVPFGLAYLADSEGGSSGSPVFLRDGTSVIGIHHSAYFNRFTEEPLYNAGTLMSYIVPEIQQWLPGGVPPGPGLGPDLVVEDPRVNTDYLLPGESFRLSVTVRNRGEAAAPATTLRFYESFDNRITSLDIEVNTASVGSLAPAATSEVSVPVTAFALGTYYYGACVDEVANETDIDNNCSTAVSVTVSTTPPPPSAGGISFNPPTIDDQTFVVNTPILPLLLPVATGGTPPYTYTLSPIPDGLDFDGTTQLLSGTPTALAEGITNVTYTATDAIGDSADLNFTIEVLEGGIPPAGDRVDVNGDGVVDVADLVIVAMAYGTRVPAGTDLPADVNLDLVVNLLDLILVVQAIDAAGGGANAISLDDIIAALAALKDVAAAPNALPGGIAYRNVAAALADARKLEKGIPETVLRELLHLLAEMKAVPEASALLPNYPNPFNPETWIPYHLAKDAEVTLRIYNVRGVAVRELMLGHQTAGVYQSKHRAAYWDGKNQIGEKVASGLYFYTLIAGDFSATGKMLILK